MPDDDGDEIISLHLGPDSNSTVFSVSVGLLDSAIRASYNRPSLKLAPPIVTKCPGFQKNINAALVKICPLDPI